MPLYLFYVSVVYESVVYGGYCYDNIECFCRLSSTGLCRVGLQRNVTSVPRIIMSASEFDDLLGDFGNGSTITTTTTTTTTKTSSFDDIGDDFDPFRPSQTSVQASHGENFGLLLDLSPDDEVSLQCLGRAFCHVDEATVHLVKINFIHQLPVNSVLLINSVHLYKCRNNAQILISRLSLQLYIRMCQSNLLVLLYIMKFL